MYSFSFEVEYVELEDVGYEDEDREVDKILRYRKYSKGSTCTREYLVLFKDEPIENATWVFEKYFCDEMIEVVKNDIKEGDLEESEELNELYNCNRLYCGVHLRTNVPRRGVVVA